MHPTHFRSQSSGLCARLKRCSTDLNPMRTAPRTFCTACRSPLPRPSAAAQAETDWADGEQHATYSRIQLNLFDYVRRFMYNSFIDYFILFITGGYYAEHHHNWTKNDTN